MCLMAPFAVGNRHICTVWFMTLGTERDFAMRTVAETASQSRMLALDLFQLDDLLRMTGQTFIGNIIGQLDNFRGMRVAVTTETSCKTIVRFAAMTLTADRNYFFNRRWMTDMTILAAYLGFVGAAIGCNRLRSCRVAFDAICITQIRFWISRSCDQCRHPHQQCR